MEFREPAFPAQFLLCYPLYKQAPQSALPYKMRGAVIESDHGDCCWYEKVSHKTPRIRLYLK